MLPMALESSAPIAQTSLYIQQNMVGMGSIDDAGSVDCEGMYGYGEDESLDDGVDFGYEGVQVDTASNNSSGSSGELKRPKRRCSITKYSLEGNTPLNAASVISDFRNDIMPNDPTPSEHVKTGLAADDSNDNTMADSTTSAPIATVVAVKEVKAIISQDTETPDSPTSKKRNSILKRFFRGMRRAQAA